MRIMQTHIEREIKRDTRRRNGSILETNITIEDTHTHTQIEETNLIVRLEHTGGPGEQLRPRKHTN